MEFLSIRLLDQKTNPVDVYSLHIFCDVTVFFFFQAEDGIRDLTVTGVQTCALPICIDEGFTSVMIDASHEAFEKNIEICRQVADYAHKHNCVVEGELGHLVGAQFDEGEEGGNYSKEGHYTHPEEAVEFVKSSGVDSLAVAIGNSHGAYKFKGEQHLDLERLKAIKKALLDAGLGDYPLVLHGASSVPKDLVEETNKYGG